MAPIDYSKWDNIDTDSEPEEQPQQAPALKSALKPTPKPAPPPANASSDSTVSSSTEAPGAPGPIQAVIVRCNVERGRFPPWSATTIPADHPVFSQQVPPVPGLINIPLVLHRMGTQSANKADLDNQIATYLNIEADHGFAPQEWQSNVGTVLVARKDKKPLFPQHLEGVWMYCSYILDYFGEGEGAPRRLYNRPVFERWWQVYCREQKSFRSGEAISILMIGRPSGRHTID